MVSISCCLNKTCESQFLRYSRTPRSEHVFTFVELDGDSVPIQSLSNSLLSKAIMEPPSNDRGRNISSGGRRDGFPVSSSAKLEEDTDETFWNQFRSSSTSSLTTQSPDSRSRDHMRESSNETVSNESTSATEEDLLPRMEWGLSRLAIGKRKRSPDHDAHATNEDSYLMSSIETQRAARFNSDVVEVSWIAQAKKSEDESPALSSSAEIERPPSSIRIKYELAPDPIQILSNEFALNQLFSDLAAANEAAVKYVNTDGIVESMLKYPLLYQKNQVCPIVLMKRQPSEDNQWNSQEYMRRIPAKLFQHIIPHVAASTWSPMYISEVIVSNGASISVSPHALRLNESMCSPNKVIGVIESHNLDFVNILTGSLCLPAVSGLVGDLLEPKQPEWIKFFNQKFALLILSSLKMFSHPPSSQAQQLFAAGVRNARSLVETVYPEFKATHIGRSILCRGFMAELSHLCTDPALAHDARVHIVSLIRFFAGTFILLKNPTPPLPEPLEVFSGNQGAHFFASLGPFLHQDISMMEEIINMLIKLIRLGVREIKQCLWASGLFELVLETALRKSKTQSNLHSVAALLFHEFALSSYAHADIVAAWLESSGFLTSVARDIKIQSQLAPDDRDMNYPYLLKILVWVNHLRVQNGEIRKKLEDPSRDLHLLTQLVPIATQGLLEKNNWESAVESPRKRRVYTDIVDQLNESIKLEEKQKNDIDPAYPSDFDDDDPIDLSGDE